MSHIAQFLFFYNLLPLQGDNKKMEDAKYYLTLPGTKAEMEEKELQASKNPSVFTPSKDITKDSFQIATLICSTKLTQNGRCGEPMGADGPDLVLLGFLLRLVVLDHVAPGSLKEDAWQLDSALCSCGDVLGAVLVTSLGQNAWQKPCE